MTKEVVYLGLGSNMGDRIANIKQAVSLLRRMTRVEVLAVSSLYETEPVDIKSKEWFINCAVKIETDLTCFELFFVLKEIETTLGRKKDSVDGSRKIDLDILVWENRILGSDSLTIPHMELPKRKFVLIPLDELSPELKIPKINKTPRELLSELTGRYAKYEVRKVEDKIELESNSRNS